MRHLLYDGKDSCDLIGECDIADLSSGAINTRNFVSGLRLGSVK
jgi:hypothetical protein